MRYLKYFENQKNLQKLYWGVRNEKRIFKKSLEKIGCPEYIIVRFLAELNNFNDIIFICYDPYIHNKYKWSLSETGGYLQSDGYEYQGPIKLTKEDLKEIEIEKDAEKYNL